MKKWIESKVSPRENPISFIFFLLDMTAATMVLIGLVQLSLDLNLLKYTIISCVAIGILLFGSIIVYIIFRKNQVKRQAVLRVKYYALMLVPSIIAIFAIVCIIGRQYMMTLLMGIVLLGFLIGYTILPRIGRFPRLSRLLIGLAIFAIVVPFGWYARGTLTPRLASQVWVMHEVDNPGFLLSNGLDPADVNKDGFDDYVTNYEWDGYLRIEFHPGLAQVKEPWPAVTIGFASNAESSGFGDFDGDGNIDVVVAHGIEIFGRVKFPVRSGVCFIWGPSAADCLNASAWQKSKDIDGTIQNGHYLYIRGWDVNNDGALDVIVGGRGLHPRAGLKWIECPATPADRRNVSKWQVHNIDAELESGHGFAFNDIDQDGDFDIALCNSDWDTLQEEEEILWYENPGTGSPDQRDPWPKHLLYRSNEFYEKGQVTFANFTGDTYPEILIQSDTHILIFLNPQNPQVNDSWEVTRIPKIPEACWYSRALKVTDINNDTKLDILGMLTHRNGALPTNKATVFWMEYSGTEPTAATTNWTTHVIKWGEGLLGFIANGEKWDQCVFEDIDRDGDLDIVANCEEAHTLGWVYISVVWFENPLV